MCFRRVVLFPVLSAVLFAACSPSTPKLDRRAMQTIVLTPSARELPAGWSAVEFREVVQRAAARWSYPNTPCGVQVAVGEPRAEWRAIRDNIDLVAIRQRSWCHNGRCTPTTTYPLRAIGMTTIYPEGATGRAVTEADIEINGVFFGFTNVATPPIAAQPDRSVRLESVLTHEIGHVLGLADVCGEHRTASGRPETSACSPVDRERMMFAAGDHESLAAGDVAALCQLYPPAE